MKVNALVFLHAESGVKGISQDAYRPGRKPTINSRRIAQVIKLTTQETPENATHWSQCLMAEKAGISMSSVGRVFPNDEAVFKALFPAIREASRKWKMIHHWKPALQVFQVMFGDERVPVSAL